MPPASRRIRKPAQSCCCRRDRERASGLASWDRIPILSKGPDHRAIPVGVPAMRKRNPFPEGEEEQFRLRESAATSALLWLFGGLAALGLAAVGFVVALVADVNQLSLHLITTLPTLLGLGALLSAWMTARTPRAVGVGPDGIRIVSRRRSR